MDARPTILDIWQVTPAYLTDVVLSNPSLRGMILGYLSERKLRDVFEMDDRAISTRKDDDHDCKKKGDLVVTYRGYEFRIEVKSLQTNKVEMEYENKWIQKIIKTNGKYTESAEFQAVWSDYGKNARYRGAFQCDASDRRSITLPDGEVIDTTCLQVGEFDIVAAGLFAFREEWDFAFAMNTDLPRSAYKKYPEAIRNKLLKSLFPSIHVHCGNSIMPFWS